MEAASCHEIALQAPNDRYSGQPDPQGNAH
jgi:hypothetical protein